ncbi:diacylglycerol kinase (ATP) [Mesoflavibacter sabulilitoris]|uniref:Diacylglycerol kinase n=1 Tax=Mesoflavibacter zeaxanthinifaciens subsp. sabulilitoris TaxID=1520893 RepID=A0A2T1NH11_9FLAO|nr:diacylglycerol kinase family protein [Mesoflavibacter zeaxanthinifaciens]MBB3122756.1 diacylglycerol kinase (ATP) [Mesoflavibacter zeaxanthinifaciens subsp. sabulilitoris]PSG92158.1 diacylglycerol kinase [Mesoflavibacter zeaxanthinifaciens subsp. sabulilitoris]
MSKTKEPFIINRLKSVKYAFLGMLRLIKTEASIQIQFVIAIIVTVAGFYYSISNTEWIMQCFAIGMVMSIEGLNTAVEEVANFIHPNHHPKIGIIKDVAAGAVFIASIAASIIGLIIYFPKIF